MLEKEIAHFLLFRKPPAFLLGKKKVKYEYKKQEMSSPSEQCLFSLCFQFYKV